MKVITRQIQHQKSRLELFCKKGVLRNFAKNKKTKKKQYLKHDLKKFHETPLTETANLRFEKVIYTWTDILQLHFLVLLIPHILGSLIINNENQNKTLFFLRGYSKFPIGPYKHETAVPQIWILDGKETGTIKWNWTPLLNLKSSSSVLLIEKH